MGRKSLACLSLSVLAVLLTLSTVAHCQEPVLELVTVFEKETYGIKDNNVKLSFTLRNIGDELVYVNKRFFVNSSTSVPGERDVALSIISPSGEKMEFKAKPETGLPRTQDFVLLGPGEEVSLERQRNIRYYFEFKDPGVYTVEAVYQNVYGEEIGVDAYKGKVTAAPVQLEFTAE